MDKGTSAAQTGLSQVEPVPVSPADAASIPSAEEAKELARAAAAKVRAIHASYEEALAAVRAEWEPQLRAARVARTRADTLLGQAIAAETPDHELHGRRVFRVEPIRQRFSQNVIGENRIEGIIETYRPGTDMGRGYSAATNLNPGEPYVRLLKKDGKVGTRTEHYQTRYDEKPRWQLASAMSARSGETEGLDPKDASATGAAGGAQ